MTSTRPTIGVIDDDVSSRESLAGLIQSFGYDVVSFASAMEYLRAGPQGTLMCLVVDVQMPQMSGLDLQNALTDQGVSLPVILVSAHDAGDLPARAAQSGAVAFLPKPVAADALLAHLMRLPTG